MSRPARRQVILAASDFGRGQTRPTSPRYLPIGISRRPPAQNAAVRGSHCAEETSKQGRMFMKKMLLLATLLGAWPACGLAQTMEELVNDGKNTDNVLNHSMGFDRKSYSALKQINKSNVKRLVPIWSTSLMNDWGELSAPTVYNGVIYAINGKWTFAIDVETGRQLWRTPVELEPEITRRGITRGAPVLYNGKLFRVTVDNHVVALDMNTGKQASNHKFAEPTEV